MLITEFQSMPRSQGQIIYFEAHQCGDPRYNRNSARASNRNAGLAWNLIFTAILLWEVSHPQLAWFPLGLIGLLLDFELTPIAFVGVYFFGTLPCTYRLRFEVEQIYVKVPCDKDGVPMCGEAFMESHKIKRTKANSSTMSVKKHNGWQACFSIAKKVAMWE